MMRGSTRVSGRFTISENSCGNQKELRRLRRITSTQFHSKSPKGQTHREVGAQSHGTRQVGRPGCRREKVWVPLGGTTEGGFTFRRASPPTAQPSSPLRARCPHTLTPPRAVP